MLAVVQVRGEKITQRSQIKALLPISVFICVICGFSFAFGAVDRASTRVCNLVTALGSPAGDMGRRPENGKRRAIARLSRFFQRTSF